VDFNEAIHFIATRLEAKQPSCLNPAWIARHCSAAYRFIIMSPWKYHDESLHKTIAGCIRRYRYTGSFLHYLFRSLELGSRQLPHLRILSLDDLSPFTGRRRLDFVVQDGETHEARMFVRNGR
jgi:hypothetical protein